LKNLFIILVAIISFVYGENLKIVGATTIQPIVQSLHDDYNALYDINLIVSGGGSSAGVQSIVNDIADIGMIARSLSLKEKEDFSFVTIGFDVLVIIVNESNPIKSITKAQLIDIYSGKTNNWLMLNGQNKSIIATTKGYGRGSLSIFEDYMELYSHENPRNSDISKQITKEAWIGEANNDVLVWVGGLENSIGFISYGNAVEAINQGMPIKIIPIDGLEFSIENVINRTYPLTRELNLIYSKENKQAHDFAIWMVEEIAQKELRKHYFIGVVGE
jgi:phosphate transport system substrate-binding protein